MSSMANCPTRSCRSFPATRSSAGSMRSAPASRGCSMGERVGIPWLGHTCGVCPYCIGGTGKSLRSSALHRIHARRRLRDGDDRRCALCVSARRGRQRRGARPLALRRPDRLALAGDRRRRQEAWALRLWRRGPYHGAGREMAGAIGVCLHAAGRCCHAGLRPDASAPHGRADPTRCRRSRSMLRSSLRPLAISCRWR